MSRRRVNKGARLTYQYGLPVIERHDYRQGRDPWTEKYVIQSVECASQFFPKGTSVLDIGCAYGYAVNMFSKLGYKAGGIDKHVDRKVFPKERLYNVDFYKMSKEIKPGFVENMFINHTLEHAGELFPFLDQCVKTLKSDGMVFVAVPHIDDEWSWDFRDSTTHYAGFNEKFLEGCWKRYGFKTLYLKTHELSPKRKPRRREIWYVGKRVRKMDKVYETMVKEAEKTLK